MPPAAAAPSTELPRHHVHHSYIWLESVRTIFIIAVCVVVANFSTIIGLVAEEGMGAEAGFIMAVAGIGTLVVILLTFGIVAGLRVVGYKHLYFTVGPDEFTLCSGIFNKKQVHVPYQRVQSVDQRATLPSAIVRRVYGFHRHGRRRGEQGRRGALRHQGPGRVAARRALQPQERSGRSGCRCVGHGGCSECDRDGHGGCGRPDSAVGGAGIAAMAQGRRPLPATCRARPPRATCSMWAPRHGTKWAACSPALLRIPAALPTSTVSLTRAVPRGSFQHHIGGAHLRRSGCRRAANRRFHLRRDGGCGRWCRGKRPSFCRLPGFGLPDRGRFGGGSSCWCSCCGCSRRWVPALGTAASRRAAATTASRWNTACCSHTFQGIDIDRVQSVVVKQSFIRRLLGYCELSLGKIDAGTDEDSSNQKNTLANQGIIIHPFVKMNRVPEILAGLVPEFSDLPP